MPDVVLVVTAILMVRFVFGAAAASVELPPVLVDVPFAVVNDLLVPVLVGVDVGLDGTAESQSTVTFTPPILALLEAETTVLLLDDDEAAAGPALSKSV